MYCPVVREQRKNKHTWKTVSFSQLVEGFQYSLQAKSRNINYLLQNCDKTLIIEERNKAIQALTTMRDKAMELRTNME